MTDIKIKQLFFSLLVSLFFVSPFLHSQVMIMGDLTREKEVSPGSAYEDKVVIKNTHDSLYFSIRIYQTDYLSFCNDSFEYPGISQRKVARSNSAWVSYSPSAVTIAPNSYASINFMVTVPNDPNLSGSYWSMIMLEIEGSTDNPLKARINTMMTSKFRYAVTVVNHISNTGIRKLNVKNIALIKNENNVRILNFEVENIGERALRPEVLVDIYDASTGSRISVNNKDLFKGRKSLICPNNCTYQSIPIGILSYGLYKTNIVFESSYDEVFSFQFNIKVDK